MEEIVRELHELLKAHSTQVHEWIKFLKAIQSSIAGDQSLWGMVVRSITTRQKAYQSQPGDIPKTKWSTLFDEDFIDITARNIKDTKLEMQTLEYNVKKLLNSIQCKFKGKPEPETEHPEHTETEHQEHTETEEEGCRVKTTNTNNLVRFEAPLPVVQVYDHGDYAKDVVSSFMETVKDQFVLAKVHQLTDIDKDKPLLILCQSISRLEPDLNYALEEFDTLKDLQASVVVVHSVEEHALPDISSQLQVDGGEKYKNVNLIDVAFTNDSNFYQCDMNAKALKKLKDFVSGIEATSDQSV